ncbi:MAG: homocysteine S-methyltransferase family protein, partial [Bacteroidaceae bacterium]|nr:homocysteine S-methyltransferase family protein [Bacteroidaceae bacterium]
MQKASLRERLEQVAQQGGTLILDGAMGSLIMREKLTEEAFRGTEFADSTVLLKGNNDLLVLTRPALISHIHRQYLEAGADIISTCTFSSQRISQSEYHLEGCVERLCRAGARLARAEADRMTALTPDKPRYVLGDVGPTSRMLSMSE